MRRSYHAWQRILLRVASVVACVVALIFASSAFAQDHIEDAAAAAAITDAPVVVTTTPVVSAAPVVTTAPVVAATPVVTAVAAPSTAPSAPASATASPSSSSPSPSPSASPSASAAAAAAGVTTTDVKVRDKLVFTFRAARGGRTAVERAKAAQNTIDGLLTHQEQLSDVRFEEPPGTSSAVIFIGKTPVFTLGQEDVDASGEANINVLAAQVTARLADGVSSERKRSAIATTIFSVSLLIFSALIAFWLLGRASEVSTKLRVWMTDNPERLAAIRLGKIEVVSAGATRGASSIGLTLGYRFVQITIAYVWLIFGLSLFESTRGYTEKLTGLILTPLYALATRIGSALPLFLIAGIAVLAVSILVRFVGLFFDSVARGDTKITWLPRDLARPTSTLVRFGIVVTALILASPLITGESDGALTRVGMVALIAVALAATPLLASAVVGTVVVFGRRLRKGELVEFGGRAGRVHEVRLLDVRLEDAGACDISVPHLLGLIHPTRVHRHPPLASVDIVVDPTSSQADVEKALLEAARSISSRGRVELIYMDGAGAHWRVTSATHRGDITLGRAVQDALATLGVGLGRKVELPGITKPPAPPGSAAGGSSSSTSET